MSLRGITSSMVGSRLLLDQQWRPYICLELECVSEAWLSKDSWRNLAVVGFNLEWKVADATWGLQIVPQTKPYAVGMPQLEHTPGPIVNKESSNQDKETPNNIMSK